MTPEQWVAIIGAVTAFVAALAAAFAAVVKASAESARTRAELAAMRDDMERARVFDAERRQRNDQMLAETHHQVTPNNGGSIIDATGRLEAAVEVLQIGLERVEHAHRDTAADVRGIRRDIGRIHDDARAHEHAAAREHERINARIDDVLTRWSDAAPHNVD